MHRRVILVGLAATVVVAGCSSGSKFAAKSRSTAVSTSTVVASTTSTAAATTTTTVAAPVNASTVAQAMIQAGLPMTISMTYTAADDPNHLLGRQGGYTSKVSIQDRRLPAGDLSNSSTAGGGSIECYPDSAGASKRYTYLQAFSGGIIGDGYDYVSGPCVLRVDSVLTPDQATQYQKAFSLAAR